MARQAEKESIDFEVLCYDDGSKLYKEQNKRIGSLESVTYKKFSSNIGRTAIRQKLGSDANFDWLLFVDADMMPKRKRFVKNYLLYQKKHAKKTVFFGGYAYDSAGKSNRLLRYKYGKKERKFPHRSGL